MALRVAREVVDSLIREIFFVRKSQGMSKTRDCGNYYGRGYSGINSYIALFLFVYLLEHVKKPNVN